MKERRGTALTQIIAGVILIVTGIFLTYSYQTIIEAARMLSIVALAMVGISHVIHALRQIDVRKSLLLAAVSFVLMVLFAVWPMVFTLLHPRLFGWWALINAVAIAISVVIAFRDHHPHSLWVLINGVITLIFGLLLTTSPGRYIDWYMFLAGAYLIYLGIGWILPVILPKWTTQVKMPVFVSFLLSPIMIRKIDRMIDRGQLRKEQMQVQPNTTYPLEVFLFIKETGYEMLGHCNIAFKGKSYVYGAYDHMTRRLHGITGDGVLVVADRDQFVKHVIENEHKTIISFGIELTPKQEQIIQDRIDSLMARSYSFMCDAEKTEKGLPVSGNGQDILSRMYRHTDAMFYHFHEGIFHTYSLFYTNCVYMTNYLIRNQQLDLFEVRGLITPGAYYCFLNNQYELQTGIVKSKQLFKDYEYYKEVFGNHETG